MTLAEEGIIWIEDSSIYVADKSLFNEPEDFLDAVLAHIKELLDKHFEGECGWCKQPDRAAYLPLVTTNWMVHRARDAYFEDPFWELADQPGRGPASSILRPVWCIDFSLNLTKVVLRKLKGEPIPDIEN